MNTRSFLETVLGDEGSYCIFANRLSDNRRVQKFYSSIESVLVAAENLDTEGFDAYYALGTFEEAGSRKADNVKQLRSFFLDLDCGAGKPFPDQAAALSALRKFCSAAQLPRPTLVNSGRGLHVYWPLTAPVARMEWQHAALRLNALCKKYNFQADPAVTTDAARVLRIPGTHNFKDDPAPEVCVVGAMSDPISFEDFVSRLGEHAALGVSVPVPVGAVEPSDFMAVITGSFTSRFKTIMMKTVNGAGCGQLADIVTNQETVEEPLWRAGLSIATHCVDRSKAIHNLSRRHPGYDPDETEHKASLIRGPYLCTKFNEFRPGVCPQCTHWNKIKSPIVLGREIQEADEEDNTVTTKSIEEAAPRTYVIPKYPSPYFRGKTGGVFKRGKTVVNDDGEVDEEASKDKMVYFNDLYVLRRIRDVEMGELLILRLHLPKDGVREFSVPLAAVGSKDEFRKYLAMQGVAVLNVTELMEYTMRWVNELQIISEADESHRQFGWADEEGTAFVLGNKIVYKDRVEINPPSGATIGLFPYFQPKGTLEGWKSTMEFYNRPGMEAHQFMVGISFGSALMQFQPINAAAFHLYSKESGLGKTTGMLAGASVWGDPDQLMMQERDTINTKMNRAEVYKNLPCYMDEMTNTKPQDLSDWAYQIPSGMQRNRMGPKSNVERVRGKPWKTLFASTGNTSVIERISLYKALPRAEAQRVLEVQPDRFDFASKAETDRFSAAIKDNYGHAAIPYLQYVMNNLTAVIETAEATQQKIDLAAGLTAENRFWSVLVSRTITGLLVAKKVGLIDWQIAPIIQWAVNAIGSARAMAREMSVDVESILTDYLAEHYNSMLRIKSTDDARKANTGLDHLILPDAVPRGQSLVARYEYDIKRLYLLPKPLKEWCGKQQINYAGLIAGLKSGRTAATIAKTRLGKGTHMNLPPVSVIQIDCTEFMTDETEQSMASTAALIQTGETAPN